MNNSEQTPLTSEDNSLIIKTSNARWYPQVVKAEKDQAKYVFIDDANLGIDPSIDSLFRMGIKIGKKTRFNIESLRSALKTIIAALVSIGISGIGVYVIAAAFLDPEPTTKLLLIIIAGVILVLSGGVFALKILVGNKHDGRIVLKSPYGGWEISWG